MSYAAEVLRRLAPRVPVAQRARGLVERVLDIPPRSLPDIPGNWYSAIEPWRQNVDDFDRLLLGLLGEKRLGLHFSDGNWEMTVQQDPGLDAVRVGSSQELHYIAIDPETAAPTVLKLFPRWAAAARHFLIVIDRDQDEVGRIEAGQKYPGSQGQITIGGEPGSPVFFRSHWLLQDPILLFNILDFSRPEKLAAFRDLRDFYQMDWLQKLDKIADKNFFLMLFAVANGIRLLDALEGLNLHP